MLNLNGIPISEEQCIGDSLPIINDSFKSLSGASVQLHSNIVANQQEVYEIEQNLKTDYRTRFTSISSSVDRQYSGLHTLVVNNNNTQTQNLQLTSTSLLDKQATLSSNLSLTSVNLRSLIEQEKTALINNINNSRNSLLTLLNGMSSVHIVTSSFYTIAPQDHLKTLVIHNNNDVTIRRATGTFQNGHRTNVINLGTGKVTFDPDFYKILSGFKHTLKGQFTSATVFYTNATFPWMVYGELEEIPKPTPPPTPTPVPPMTYKYSLRGPQESDDIRKLSVKGHTDTLYYNDADSSGKTLTMNISVRNNGNTTSRLNVNFSERRTNEPFGFQMQNRPEILVGRFQSGNVILNSSFPPDPTPTAQPPQSNNGFQHILNGARTIDNESERIEIFTARKSDTLFFNNDPNPNNYDPITFDIFVNNVWRMTVYTYESRVNQAFAILCEGTARKLVHGIFTRGDGDSSEIYLTEEGAPFLPPPTPTPIWNHKLTGPDAELLGKGVGLVGYPDTIFFNDDLISTSGNPQVVVVRVNSEARFSLSCTTGFVTGKNIAIRLTGSQQDINATFDVQFDPNGVRFVNIITGFAPVPTPTPNTVNPLNKILTGPADESPEDNMAFWNTGRTDKLFYSVNPSGRHLEMKTERMNVFVNNVQVASVDFDKNQQGRQFGYNANNSNTPQATGLFQIGNVALNLTGGVPPTPTATRIPPTQTPPPTPTGATYPFKLTPNPNEDNSAADPVHDIGIQGYADTIFYNSYANAQNETEIYTTIYVNGLMRTLITFDPGRAGTTFRYLSQGVYYTGTFPSTENDPISFFDDTFKPTGTKDRLTYLFSLTPDGSSTEAVDVAQQISIIGHQDSIHYNSASFSPELEIASTIYVNGVMRTQVVYDPIRHGTTFMYTSDGINYQGTFDKGADGRGADIRLGTQTAPTPTPTLTPTATLPALADFPNKVVGPSGSQGNVEIFNPGKNAAYFFKLQTSTGVSYKFDIYVNNIWQASIFTDKAYKDAGSNAKFGFSPTNTAIPALTSDFSKIDNNDEIKFTTTTT